MGIDSHAFRFLCYASVRGTFGDVLTIGRQRIDAKARLILDRFPNAPPDALKGYSEGLLTECFAACTVNSLDFSDYERATIVHDLNEPVPADLHGRFDTILDFGTSEHVFDIAGALRNYTRMIRPGGQILHVLPTNNFCGHGFWQISPEAMFALYRRRDGFHDTEVFIAELSDATNWFRVREPTDGYRVNIESSRPLYVLARTVRAGVATESENVPQQSDYVHAWSATVPHAEVQRQPSECREMMRWIVRRIPWARGTIDTIRQSLLTARERRRWRQTTRVNDRHPFLERVNIELLAAQRGP